MKKTLLFVFVILALAKTGHAQVGIGTNNPSQMLHIFKSAGTSAIYLEQTISAPGTQQSIKSAGSGVNVSGPGKPWFTPEYIVSNDVYNALADLTDSVESAPLRASAFGFNIPSDAIITGIKVDVLEDGWKAVTTTGKEDFTDLSVKLVVGGNASGADRATTNIWPHPEAYVAYGGSSDMWGLPLTPAIVNAADFGFQISCKLPSNIIIDGDAPTIGDYAKVNHVQMTVYYTVGQVANGWLIGGDYNDNGKFKITQGSSFGSGDIMTVTPSGNIGIGTVSPGEKLQVNGNIKATTFIATYSSAGAYKYNTSSNMAVPDYVFDQYFRKDFCTNPQYKMLGLDELGDYLKVHRHLPGVPSRDDIESEGKVNLQGLTMINLEKTEENTLYILELKKQNEILLQQINKLKEEVNNLKKMVK